MPCRGVVMSDIGVGDWVECVDSSPMSGTSIASCLVLGAFYVVERVGYVGVGFSNSGDASVWLVGFPAPSSSFGDGAYAATRFRPIRDPQARIVRHATTKDRVRV